MNQKLENARPGVNPELEYKSTKPDPNKQEFVPIYKDIANPKAVQAEIGDIISIFNEEIKLAKEEVMKRRDAQDTKYKLRGFYSQDMNATIKERILNRLQYDPAFRNSVRDRKNSGSIYFVIRDKYVLYVKRLYGKQNKPNCYPTPQSERLFNGTLLIENIDHIPVLFIGPNLGNIGENDAFVTSLISRKEVNWSLACSDLFAPAQSIGLQKQTVETQEKEIVRLSPALAPIVKIKNNK